jgi:HD-GYP domain-containing protein (c-di-GMP phosphodiesterase class II)
MGVISKKSVTYVLSLIAVGVIINRVAVSAAGFFNLPLYLDSVGTMFVAVVGGISPGMFVGFLTNMIGGLEDSTTFYYGTINVLIALIAGMAADRGHFKKITGLPVILPFYLLLSIPCSFLTYLLYEFRIGENVASSAVNAFCNLGLSTLSAQILGDLCIELPDKSISLLVTFFLIRLVPENIRKEFLRISGRDPKTRKLEENEEGSSLKIQVALILFLSGLAIVFVAYGISYKTYMEARVSGFPTSNYDVHQLRIETMLYSGRILSAVMGLLLCIVSFSIVLANRMVVTPLLRMAREMRRFAYDSEAGREKSVSKIEALDIQTRNEIQELYMALTKTVKEFDQYIVKTQEQSQTIADLHINIITTLADIVESRDETTGNHVKRTAAYAALLAEELRRTGKHVDIITDDYINTLTIAAPLHDIGKIKIPDAILNKPARLTDEEFEVIKTHTSLGGDMLEDAGRTMGETQYLDMARDIALYHHEWWNGASRGYPEGKQGEEIPLSARIMAVADVLDALLSKRPYKEEYSLDQAFEIMLEESGTHFDPDVIGAMIDCKETILTIIEKYAYQK